MFICEPCIKRFRYDGYFRLASLGACETCGKRVPCADVPQEQLQPTRPKRAARIPPGYYEQGATMAEADAPVSKPDGSATTPLLADAATTERLLRNQLESATVSDMVNSLVKDGWSIGITSRGGDLFVYVAKTAKDGKTVLKKQREGKDFYDLINQLRGEVYEDRVKSSS